MRVNRFTKSVIGCLGCVLVVSLLGACASNRQQEPGTICAKLADNKGWMTAVRAAKKKWDMPVHVGLAFIHRESSFVANARPPRKRLLGVLPMGRSSSAYGYAQATNEAWSDYKKSTGKRFVRRDDFEDAIDFVGWYNDQSNRRLRIKKTDAYRLYLAYYSGHGGYERGTWRKSKAVQSYARKAADQSKRYAREFRRCKGRIR